MVLISAFPVNALTLPVKTMPVSGSTNGGSGPVTRCGSDFQMIRGSSTPTSVQSAPSGSGDACCLSDAAAVGKSTSAQTAPPHGLSGGTLLLSSICLRSTSRTRPAPSTTTAMSPRGITRTETAPAGIQTTSTSELQSSAPASPSLTTVSPYWSEAISAYSCGSVSFDPAVGGRA